MVMLGFGVIALAVMLLLVTVGIVLK